MLLQKTPIRALHKCVEERRLSTDSQHEVTYTLTTSTLTSCTDTPPLRSPTAPPPFSPPPFSPPSSPRHPLPPPSSSSLAAPPHPQSFLPQQQQQQQQLQQSYSSYISSVTGASSLVADPHMGTPVHQAGSLTYPPYQATFPFSSGGHTLPPHPFLTPYSTSLPYPPSPSTGLRVTQPVTQAGGGGLSANHLASSQTSLFTPQMPFSHPPPVTMVQSPTATLQPPSFPAPHPLSPLLGQAAPSPLPPVGSPSRGDNQTDILLKEISRLRERLAQLEGENTALTVKLTQQQWDVESRLNELEMHLGHSDSIASTDLSDDRGGTGVGGAGDRAGSDRGQCASLSAVVNKESII
ncbi:hypothetical protein ACOMHN_062059 [Nucella lapillus]